MPPILKIDSDDEEKEIDFEVDYLLSLTSEQRFRMMFQGSKELAEMLGKNGHRKSPEIIKRI